MSRPDDNDRALAETYSQYVRAAGAERETLGVQLDALTPTVPRRLGSTDIAAVCALYIPELAPSLPKSKTATDVWLRLKFGMEAPRNGRMSRGIKMEPFGLDYYAQHVGPWWRPIPIGEVWTLQHPRYEWATASPDAAVSPDMQTIIEVKTQSEWARNQWGEPGTDKMATRYLFQCAWLMACSGADVCHVVCVFGHDSDGIPEFVITEPAVYFVERDPALEATALELGERFVKEFVRTGIPPPVKPAHNRRDMKRAMHAAGIREWEARCKEFGAKAD